LAPEPDGQPSRTLAGAAAAVRHQDEGAAPRTRGPLWQRLGHALLVLAVLACAVGLPTWSAFATGAIDIPKNDDWAFSRIAFDLYETGQFRLVGWGVMALVGHVLWAQPWIALFGERLEVLHLANGAMSGLGLLGLYAFARHYMRPARALLVMAIMGIAPAYALMSTTFMTDPMAFATQTACLALGAWSLRLPRRRAVGVLCLSLVVGMLGFTVRETAIIAPGAVLAGHLWQELRRKALERRTDAPARDAVRRWEGRAIGLQTVLSVGTLVLSSALAFSLWRRSLPNDQVLVDDIGSFAAPLYAARAFFTAALALGPVVVLTGLGGIVRRRFAAVVVAVVDLAVLALAVIARDLQVGSEHTILTGSFLTQRGSMGSSVALGDRPILLGDALWTVIVAAALVSALVMVVRMVAGIAGRSRWREGATPVEPARVLLIVFTCGAAASVNAYAFVGGALFDRYLWPAIAGGAVLLLADMKRIHAPRAWQVAASVVWGLALLALTVVGTVEEHTFDAARWEAGEAAVARGTDASDIDAGFEWMGWHYDGVAFSNDAPLRIHPPAKSYTLLFAGVRNCEAVSSSLLLNPDLRLVDVLTYDAGLFLGERSLYTYRNDFSCRLR
jgi:hypothetical protein